GIRDRTVTGVQTCALPILAARGRLMQQLPPGGAMMAIRATEDEIHPHLTQQVSLAAVNGPSSVVVSGAEDEVLALAAHFEAEGRSEERRVGKACGRGGGRG